MKINNTKLGLGGVLLFGAMCSIIAYQAAAQRGMNAPPTSMAIVNLPVVLNGLRQRGDADVRLQQMGDSIRAEAAQKEQTILAMQEALEAIVDEAERMAEVERVEQELLDFRVWQQWNLDKIDIERAISWQDLYRSIKREIGDLARAEGYDIVLVDDSTGELRINPNAKMSREAQIQQQITGRRLLFVDEAVDISDQLITRMNNNWQAVGAGG